MKMEEINYPKFITEFSDYLVGIKNYSKTYVKNMIITLQQFLGFINAHKYHNKYDSIKSISLNDIRTLSNSDIYTFIYFLAENHYKIGTRISKIEHLRTFFDYLFRIKHNIFKEPFKQIKREKNIYMQLPNYLSLDESKKILQTYANSTKINEVRDYAMLFLMLNCGLRVSEVANLNISNFDFKHNKFVVIGKGNKERTGYLNDATKEALLKYLDIRQNIKIFKDKEALFLSSYKCRITPRGIQKAVKNVYEKSGINSEQYCVHTLRHTCATLMYKQGTDIKLMQDRRNIGMKEKDTSFNLDNIHSVELNLLDGQVEIILRSMELYAYNLEYMLNSTDATDDLRQEKLAMLRYTYEQVLASQAEQVNSKSNNVDNLPDISKILLKDKNNIPGERKFNVI